MSDGNKFPKLRALGEWGGHLANALTFLTNNWGLTLAAIVAIGTGLNKWAWGLAMTPAIYASAGAFLFVLWTIIGLTYLYDRRRPRETRTHHDYRYGLTLEGFSPVPAQSPEGGGLGLLFAIQIRNFSPGPMDYSLENIDIRLGDRGNPKYQSNSIKGYLPRGGGKTTRIATLKGEAVKDFFGKGITKGTADLSYVYGPPGEPPIRRLKLSLELNMNIPVSGFEGPDPVAYSDNIVSEHDEPI